MKTQLKYYFICSFLVFIACSEDEILIETNNLTATISNELPTHKGDGRSNINYSNDPANKIMNISWYGTDSIGVFGATKGQNILFTTSESEIFNDGKTAIFSTKQAKPEGKLTAYYPYQKTATLVNDELLLTMPHQQFYTTNTSGITIPDASSNFMVAKPSEESEKINFSNLFSLLQLGIYQDQDSIIDKLIFTDLSGMPVSGGFKVKWIDGIPEAIFPTEGTGNSSLITLDCGNGLPVSSNSIVRFFMIVPARVYSRGFQIDFMYANGGKVTKTIGTTNGKTLKRGMLYPLGDTFPTMDEFEFELSDGVNILNAEQLANLKEPYISPIDNSLAFSFDSENKISVKLNDIILINKVATTLPGGYAGKVGYINTLPDGTQIIRLDPVREITEVFSELKMGDPLWNSDGTPTEGMGVALDLASYLTDITTENGAKVPFSKSGSTIKMKVPFANSNSSPMAPPFGNLSPFTPNSSGLLISVADKFSPSYSSPELSYTFNEEKDLTATVGIQVKMNTFMSMSIHDRTLEYLHFKATPVVTLSSEFSAKISKTYNKEVPLLTFHFAPIPVGPILIIPIMKLSAVADVKGKITLSTKMEYKKELPFGFSYILGDFTYRNYISNKPETEDDSSPVELTGKFQIAGSAAVGAKIYGGFKVYGILEATANVDSRIRLKAQFSTDISEANQTDLNNGYYYNTNSNVKLEVLLNPSLGVGLTSLGGFLNGKKQSDAMDILITERYLLPDFINCKFVQNRQGSLEIAMDVKRKLLFDCKIALTVIGPGISGSTGEIFSMDYSAPPKNKDVKTVKETVDIQQLWTGRSYTVVSNITISGVTISHNLGSFVSAFDESITLTTSKAIGETITLSLTEQKGMNVWIDANNNKIEESGERYFQTANVVLGAQTITIYGNIIYLGCSDNQLTSLDLSKCGSLVSLRCLNNQLSNLDVSNCLEMTNLECSNNKLTSIKTNKTGKLASLTCITNQLTSLDLSDHKNLAYLNCANNQLSLLNISNCSKINHIELNGNPRMSIDASNCTTLSSFKFDNYPFSILNFTGCTALKELWCSACQLTFINLSGCKELKELYCQNNQLSVLNLEDCTALNKLMCYVNPLTTLDLSKNSALKTLITYNCQLSSLNVSNCPLLEQISCARNQLSALNVANCHSLFSLDLSSNSLHGSNTTNLMNSLPGRVSTTKGTLSLAGSSGLISDLDIASGKNWQVIGGTWKEK